MWLVVVVGGFRWLLVRQSGSRCCDERHSVLVCVQVTWCVKSVWLPLLKGTWLITSVEEQSGGVV